MINIFNNIIQLSHQLIKVDYQKLKFNKKIQILKNKKIIINKKMI